MFNKKRVLILGLCVFLAGCSTASYNGIETSQKPSATNPGARYLLGSGVPQNDNKAFTYFRKQADKGDVFAQNEVAYLYAVGRGTSKNLTKALHYYQLAAHQGLSSAEYSLGMMYENGWGTAPNKALAYLWFQKSASHGFEPGIDAVKRYPAQ